MANVIKIKTGSTKPGDGVLQDSELGFDKTKENLYIGNGGKNKKINISNLEDGIASGSLRTSGATIEDDTYKLGDYAFAEGEETMARGQAAHTEGNLTFAREDFSHAEGLDTIASGQCQHVQGKYNKEDATKAFIIGNGSSRMARSNALTVGWNGDLEISGDIIDGSGTSLSSLKTSVSNGKASIASAITDKGISTSSTATFDVMAANIRSIPTGGGGSSVSEIDTYLYKTDFNLESEQNFVHFVFDPTVINLDKIVCGAYRCTDSGQLLYFYKNSATGTWSGSIFISSSCSTELDSDIFIDNYFYAGLMHFRIEVDPSSYISGAPTPVEGVLWCAK